MRPSLRPLPKRRSCALQPGHRSGTLGATNKNTVSEPYEQRRDHDPAGATLGDDAWG